MPQAHPTTTTVELLREKQDIVAEKAIVDMALWGGVIPGQAPGVIRDMVGAGVVGLKSFMASSSPFFAAVDDADLFTAMITISELNVPYALHAESDALVRSGLDRMKSAGRKEPLAHADSRPPIVEEVAVNTALYFAEKTGCWIHICHVASSEALRQIANAKARGVRVTCETCPQYLSLNTDDLTVLAGFGRCAPAIRTQQEVDAIWPHVMNETVEFVCSDHCGFTMQRKAEGAHDIFAAPMGLSGIQNPLACVLRRCRRSTRNVARAVCAPDVHQRCQICRCLPAKGDNPGWFGCRYRSPGSEPDVDRTAELTCSIAICGVRSKESR